MTINEKTTTTPEEVKSSVASIYSALLTKREREREEKIETRRMEKEEKLAKKMSKNEEGEQLTKKEKREAEISSWKTVVIGLTGDDLEYIPQKKNKKKYKSWIGDEVNDNTVLTTKSKKKKKRNYQKEFDPELNMLKTIVTDQNKFTNDLLKRLQNSMGPANKDSLPLNKTQVELAAVINNSRSNSLGILREIGNVKKTIADLYMKQKKLESDLGGGNGGDSSDMGLMGSSIASSIFGNHPSNTMETNTQAIHTDPVHPSSIITTIPQAEVIEYQKFDPSSWSPQGDEFNNASTIAEAIPHTIIVEWNESTGFSRFKAVRDDNGTELSNAPGLPTCKIKEFNKDTMMAKDEFDQSHKLEIIR